MKTKTQGVPDHLVSQWVRDLYRDVFIHGLDCTILIHGRKRTGKSWLALKLLELLNLWDMEVIDYKKIIEDRVHFRVGEFAKAIGRAKKKGMVLVLDEAGVDASNMEWWKTTLKNLRDIQHVDGIRHLILIVVLPKMAHLAKSSRDMVNVEIKTIHCDKRRKRTKVRIKHKGFFSAEKDKGVYHRTRAGDTINATYFGPPSKELTSAYEEISRVYKEDIINEKIGEIVNSGAQTKLDGKRSDEDIIDEIMENPTNSKIVNEHDKITVAQLQDYYEIPYNVATRIRQKVAKELKKNK